MSSNFFNIYSHYFRNYYRSKSFYLILIIVALASVLMSYLTFKYSNRVSEMLPSRLISLSKVNSELLMMYLWAYIMSSLPVFASVFFSSPAISSEIEMRTGYFVFSQPVDRTILVLAKYMAAVTVTIISLLVYAFSEVISIIYVYGFIEYNQLLWSMAMLILFILALTAFTFLLSSVFNKNLYAYITSFVVYFVIFYAVNLILYLLYNYNAFFLLNNAATIIERVYININPTIFTSNFSLNPAGINDIILSSVVFIIYTIACLVGAIVVVENKEVQ